MDIKDEFLNFLKMSYGAESQVAKGSLPPLVVGPSFPAFNTPVNQGLQQMMRMRQPQLGGGMMGGGMMGGGMTGGGMMGAPAPTAGGPQKPVSALGAPSSPAPTSFAPSGVPRR